jgi:diadenosine tetraphosphate (Ap4A) HIT family hydrolase
MASTPFKALRDFLTTRMRMAHIYQPLMIRTLLTHGGRASIRQIASTFLSKDASQLEYYEEITKNMPGKVLARHGIVRREGNAFQLLLDISALQPDEKDELVRLCDAKADKYMEKRGAAIFAHRALAAGYVPGSVRYEVLKRAGGRCELCGIAHEERALEVDHIVPRKEGGPDDLANYQALCWKCNTNKGARDSTDFRQIRDLHQHRESGCVFCDIDSKRVVAENALAVAVRDAHPVTRLHTLLIPKRHTDTYFNLFSSERRAIEQLVDSQRAEIAGQDRAVGGFNIGINAGDVAGQTIMHCHVHLIPRRAGDVPSPRGGVRHVIPEKGSY